MKENKHFRDGVPVIGAWKLESNPHDKILIWVHEEKEDACLQICTIVRLEDAYGRSMRAFLDTNSFSKITGGELGPSLDVAISQDSCLDFVQEIVGRRVQVAISNHRNPNPGGKVPPVYTVETTLSPEDLTGEANQKKRLLRRR